METSIIIPNYLGTEVLPKCLRSLNSITQNAEIIISDDCSGENIEKLIEDSEIELPVRIVRRYVNEGFAPAINSGVDISQGEFLVFLNNDANVKNDWLTHLLTSIRLDEKIGAVQSAIVRENGSIDCYGGRIDELGFPHEIGRGNIAVEEKKIQIIDYTKAASMIIRRQDYFNFGRFDNSFYLGYESVDLCWRMRNNGRVMLFDPRSVAVHISRHASSRVSHPIRWYHSTKNHLTTFMRNAKDEQLKLSTDLILAIRDEQIKRHLGNGHAGTATAIKEGIQYAVSNSEVYLRMNEFAKEATRLEMIEKLKKYLTKVE